MQYVLCQGGEVLGRVSLDGPEGSGVSHLGLLAGELEPTPAYERVRAACSALVPAPPEADPDGPPLVFGDPTDALARVRELGLELRTTDGVRVPTHLLHVTDVSAIASHLPPPVREEPQPVHVSAVLARPGEPWPPDIEPPAT